MKGLVTIMFFSPVQSTAPNEMKIQYRPLSAPLAIRAGRLKRMVADRAGLSNGDEIISIIAGTELKRVNRLT
jgi:hypothetical protein